MSDKKNKKQTKEKVDPQSSPRSLAQRETNEGASGSDVRQSPRLLDRLTNAFGGARPKTSAYMGKERKSKKEYQTKTDQSPKKYKSAADKFRASQAPLANSSCSSLDSSEELDSDNQEAGNSSGKSAAGNSPLLQKKSKSFKLNTATGSPLKNLFKRSPKRKDESKMNLMEPEETNIDEEVLKTAGKIKKKRVLKFGEYTAITENFSRATIGRTPSTGPDSDPTYSSELDSTPSSPEKEMAQLQIDQKRLSSGRDARKSTIARRSLSNPSQERQGEKHEPRATLLRDESKQKRREAASPYPPPVEKCRCKDGFHRTPGCPIMKRKKEIHNRKKGLGPPRRKSKSPSPKRN